MLTMLHSRLPHSIQLRPNTPTLSSVTCKQPASYHPLVAANKADAQSKKRTAAIAEFIVEEQTARRESEIPRAYFDPSDSPIEYKIIDPDPKFTNGILDSGASISVTNPRTVAYYGLTLIPWDTGPVRIQFGDGNVETSTHYVNLNSVFTKIAVMENAPDTLISIFDLVLAGFEIKQKLVGTGIYLNDNLVFPGTICHQTRLFYMDLNAIVNSNILVPQLSQLAAQQRIAAECPATSVSEPLPPSWR